jgi:hypothetical protein
MLDDENSQISSMGEYVESYKRQISQLKRGKSSGITRTFGKPILPEEILSAYEAKENGDGKEAREAIASVEKFADSLLNDEALEDDAVVATFFQNGQKMYLLSDESVVAAADYVRNTEQPQLVQQTASKIMPALLPPDTAPHMHVCTEGGDWLWDIFYENRAVTGVQANNGILFRKMDNATVFVKVDPPGPSDKCAKLTLLDGFIADPRTGNLFWRELGGKSSGAFLNNGWLVQDTGNNEFYVTQAVDTVTGAGQCTQVFNLQLDMEQGVLSFDTSDGRSVQIKSRRLT